MNKIKIRKIFSGIIFGIILFVIIIYFSIWIYICNSVPKDLKYSYNQNIESYLNDEQYDIIFFLLNGNKKHKYKWYPLILDFIISEISEKNHNYLASMTASTIIGEYLSNDYRKKMTSIDWHIKDYALMRYIVYKNDYRKCINIIFKNIYMGENIFGIENACKHYFEKEITNLSTDELVSLIVLSYSPTRFKINSEENKIRVMNIIHEYNL